MSAKTETPAPPVAIAAPAAAAAVPPAATAAASTASSSASSSTAWNTVKALTAGGVAGALSRTVTSPLERLKVMKQIQSTGNAYAGTFKALAKMYREEGIRSYWKGNGTNVVRIAPYSAIQFFAFDKYKRFLIPEDSPLAKTQNFEHTVRLLTAGALAGATSSISCYPLDLVRSVLTVQTDPTALASRQGMVGTLIDIHKREGVRGLYRGLAPTLMGIAPYVAINFAVFDSLKTRFLPDRSSAYFDLTNLGLGAVAGATSAAMTYPTDVIRRRMQLQGLAGSNLPAYHSTWHCIQTVYRMETVRGFYKGLTACLLKVVPSVALSWATYERLKQWWKFAPPPKSVSAGG